MEKHIKYYKKYNISKWKEISLVLHSSNNIFFIIRYKNQCKKTKKLYDKYLKALQKHLEK